MSWREPLLFAAGTVFLGLPFLPAIWEALRPSDEEALEISRFQLLDPRRGTRQVAWRYCSMLEVEEPGKLRERLMGSPQASESRDGEIAPGVLRLVRGGAVPPGYAGTDVVSAESIRISPRERIGARVYSLANVELEDRSEVLEAHAEDELRIRSGAKIAWWGSGVRARLESGALAQGSIVASEELRIAQNVRFGLLRSPVIRCDSEGEPAWVGQLPPAPAPGAKRQVFDRDLRVEPGECIEGDLIVRGSLSIGVGVQVRGSIKARGDIRLESGVQVRGSLVAGEGIELGQGVRVGGCVLGERWVRLGERSVVGSPGHLASVSGQKVEIAPGALVHGMIRAWKEGYATRV